MLNLFNQFYCVGCVVWFGTMVLKFMNHEVFFLSCKEFPLLQLCLHAKIVFINSSINQNLLCVVCRLQVSVQSAQEAFMVLVRPAKPWDKCTTTAASPAVSAVRLTAHVTVQMHRNITQGR